MDIIIIVKLKDINTTQIYNFKISKVKKEWHKN